MKRLALVLLVACGPAITKADPPGVWSEIVADMDYCPSRAHCPRWLPFAHLGEDGSIGDIYWLVSTSGHACEIPGNAAYVLDRPWSCRWRPRRS